MINDAPSGDILQATEQKLESQLTPPVRAAYDKIVTAGMKLALNNGPNGIAASIKQSKNPIPDIVKGAINIVGMLGMQSRGTMPIKAAVPACMTLIIQGLDFAKRAGVIKGDQADLTQATRLFGAEITGKFGITRPMLATAAGNLQKLAQDPASMEKLKQASGLSKHPNATPAPEMALADDGEADDQGDEA
jgi:hypothetical protein